MAVWPQPRFVEHGASVLWITSQVNFLCKRTDRQGWFEGLEHRQIFLNVGGGVSLLMCTVETDQDRLHRPPQVQDLSHIQKTYLQQR